ncbi:MAG: hypothetical protein K1X47_15980 [Cyclobacteriaceae bacterium]|nr:hypothetical protein [Cyclobacteriaceae bacterium]
MPNSRALEDFFAGKSQHVVGLFDHFVAEFRKIGPVTIHPAKTMIGLATPRKRIVYVTRLGKDFMTAVFPFDRAYPDQLCFEKIANVPGDVQHNHYFRMMSKSDVNPEIRKFMKLAWELGT